jgi:hypothetical protein
MGIFKPEILVDLMVYGVLGGACSLGVFAVIVFGFGGALLVLRRPFSRTAC